jgi:hypothetical protein
MTFLDTRFARIVRGVFTAIAVSLTLAAGRAVAEEPVVAPAVKLPTEPALELRLVRKLGPGPGNENSGIVKSRNHDDVFWIHNDSGDEPRVYAVHRDGTSYEDERYPEEQGVLIGGAINVDWEAIAIDNAGRLIVADVGNNGNDRRDLVLYVLEEPSPVAGRTAFLKKLFIKYPDQKSFPAGKGEFNFDCEAVFTIGETVHFLSKHRSDSRMTHYRLDDPKSDEMNTLTLLGRFDLQGQAVGADCTEDGKRLVVISYTGVWLFERNGVEDDFFAGQISYAPYGKEREIESVCFADDKTILLADEGLGELYEVSIADLVEIQAAK